MLTETILEDDRWQEAGLDALAEAAARATLAHLNHDPAGYEIAVLACDDARIAVLNADFRGKPQPTNVLSWPEEDLAPEEAGADPEEPPQGGEEDPHHLGDIAIAWETCTREAAEQGKPFAAHVSHLLVHGVLHLLGFDHIRDKDATLMEACERAILGKLGIPDPYGSDQGRPGPQRTE
ncbi:rRNA maturation RNase YbeY [Marinovum sp.]|uniref:rRNA maturation RNase YbeY n=1 Tax=Marinovum sp. TaxID=2024839 RepID=UPI002B270C31|nr:rRNA maturation RNase YbeY [Marinovum sp.]